MLLITSSWTTQSMMQSSLASRRCWRMACTRLIYLQTCDILGAVAPCAACAFVFALLTTQIEKAGKLDVPQSGSELLGIIIYTILLVVAVISNVGMLVMTV